MAAVLQPGDGREEGAAKRLVRAEGGGGLDIEGAIGRPSVERASKSPGPVEKGDEDMEGGEGEAQVEVATEKEKEKGKGRGRGKGKKGEKEDVDTEMKGGD